MVTRACAERLAAAGATWDHTGKPVQLMGVGDGVTWARERIRCEVNLHDERRRRATLLVCDELPHDCLLGWDFLCAYALGVKPGGTRGSLKVFRETSRGSTEVIHIAGVNMRCTRNPLRGTE